MDETAKRYDFAIDVCRRAGALARDFFARRSELAVDVKGTQDWVSEADRSVEAFLRREIAAAWPEDGILGEEEGATDGPSGFTWVIDPIDGTTNFVNGIPAWCVVLAGVSRDRVELGVIHEPMVGETYAARHGAGATLNGAPMQVAKDVPLDSGTVSVGYSNRIERSTVAPLVAMVIERGAMFHRNASGALSLAYVASGRLLGYVEAHMNAWDCLAGQLMIREAGGRTEDQDPAAMMREGGRVIAGAPQVFDDLREMAEAAWA